MKLIGATRADALRRSREATVLHVVSGPTSSGKSTYLKDLAACYDSVLFASHLVDKDLEPGHHALHYNILRPIAIDFDSIWLKALRQVRILPSSRGTGSNPSDLYERDPVWRALLRGALSIHATVLVAPQRILLERVARRNTNEPLFSRRDISYQKEKWTRILLAVDLIDLYRQWLVFLESHQITYDLVDSCDSRYLTIPGKSALFDFLKGDQTID